MELSPGVSGPPGVSVPEPLLPSSEGSSSPHEIKPKLGAERRSTYVKNFILLIVVNNKVFVQATPCPNWLIICVM